jgi:flagellar hook-length control protein FliK
MKPQKCRQSQRPAPKASDAPDNLAYLAFGLLVEQFVGPAQQPSPPAARGEKTPENAGSISLPQTLAAPPDVPGQEEGAKGAAPATRSLELATNEGGTAKESAGPLTGENGATDQTAKAEKDTDTASAKQPIESLTTKSDAKRDDAEQVYLEKASLDDTTGMKKDASSENNSLYPASQAASDSESQQVSHDRPIKAETGKKQSGPGTINCDAEKTDSASLVKNEASAALQPTGNSAGERGPGATEGSQHVRVHADNPVEHAENNISILKDGDQLAVKLEPDGLGKININLSLDNGKIHAQINVQDSSTKNLIENNMREIVDTLVKEGLTVGGFSVSLNNGDAGKQMVEHVWKDKGKGPGTSPAPGSVADKTAVMGLVNIYA